MKILPLLHPADPEEAEDHHRLFFGFRTRTRKRLFFALFIAWSLIIPVGGAWRA